MKLLFCVTLSLVLGNFSVLPIAIDVAKNFVKSNENGDETKLTDLDRDCAFIIFEHLNSGELLNVAQIDDKFSTVAADLFRCKYSHLDIVVWDEFALPNKPNELLNVAGMEIDTDTIDQVNELFSHKDHRSYENIKETETEIIVRNGDAILNLFKHFGHSIKKICALTDREYPVQSELIGKLISKYSSESLVDMQFQDDARELLQHITKPLVNVESVSFVGNRMTFNRNIRINEILPVLHRLHLFSLKYHDLAYFNRHFPHLEEVAMARLTENEHFAFPNVILKNPQIKSITLKHMDAEFVRKVNVHLPQLETLNLMDCELGTENIRFENVTTLIIDHREDGSLANLHFPCLQRIEINKISNRDEYFNFLSEHNHLSEFHVCLDSWINAHLLHRLTENLKNLVTLTLDDKFNKNRLSSDDIVEFLRTHVNVKQLNVINSSTRLGDKLQEKLQREWNTQTANTGLSFVRKPNITNHSV